MISKYMELTEKEKSVLSDPLFSDIDSLDRG